MRVVVAPDKFAGTLSAGEATRAITEGWRRHAPRDDLVMVPMSDGGPGFLRVVQDALGGERRQLEVSDPYGAPVTGGYLLHEGTAYVEAAQACGLHLTPPESRDPERASSEGVGRLVRAAAAEADRVVIGLGGSGTNDGGAGLLSALGAVARPPESLSDGPRGLQRLAEIDLAAPRELLEGVGLVAATDVDNPLLGLIGASAVYGPQKGLSAERVMWADAALERLATATDRRTALSPGAGAAGGLGFALLLLGAERTPGLGLVAQVVGLGERIATADLVITGEGAFDFSSRSGKVPYGVASVAAQHARPCIALAGRVLVGSRETRALGMESAYSMVDLVGEEASTTDPAESLSVLAARVARSWSV